MMKGRAGRTVVELLKQIGEHLQRGGNEKVAELTRRAIEDGTPAVEILGESAP
jgi:hypothetical protein